MASSKATCFFVQPKFTASAEVLRNPPPPLRRTRDQISTATPFVPSPPNFVQPEIDQGTYKFPPFVKYAPQFHIGDPSIKHTLSPTITRCEAIPIFQLLQASLDP